MRSRCLKHEAIPYRLYLYTEKLSHYSRNVLGLTCTENDRLGERDGGEARGDGGKARGDGGLRVVTGDQTAPAHLQDDFLC